ncbi:ABC transporter permease [Bacteroidota bacterium]
MFRIYLKLTIRDLMLNKGYFFINLLGLIIGITAFTLIVFWIKAETSYDTFHKNAQDIYRVDYLLYEEEVLEQHSASGSHGIGKEIQNAFPEVLDHTRFFRTEGLVKYGEGNENETIKERNLLYAESSFFNLFSFPLIQGVADSSLLALDHAVITEECARKYFGDENPIGKILRIDGRVDYMITGLVKSIPRNSHFTFDILLSYENLLQQNRRYWDNAWVSERVYTYLLLAPGADAEALESKLPQIPETFIGESMKRAFYLIEYKLVKLTDIHLHSSVSNELEVNGNYRNVNSLGIIALLVLLIAFINYLNLATSRSVERAHEVGIRKVSGALKKDLILQFLTESASLNLVALIISFTGVFLLLPFFKQAMQSPLQIDILTLTLLFFILLVTGTLFTGFLSAIYSSQFKPTLVLKGKIPGGSGWIGRLKNFLVVFQFTVSVILIIGTITIYRQVNFMRHHDLGFKPEGLIVLDGPRILNVNSYESYLSGMEAFKNDIKSLSMVRNITSSTSIPGTEITNSRVYGIPVEGRNTEKKIEVYYVDDQFFDTYGISFTAGENFYSTILEDSSNIILNEAALSYFGFEDAQSTIGEVLRGGRKMVFVKGIVKDFNQQIMKELPGPIGFFHQPGNQYYTIKAEMTDISRLISELEKIWMAHYPGNPYLYFFLDDFYNEQYRAEQRFSGLFLAGSLLAIIIACMGLSGLSTYAIIRRTKEIGIRKANGATVSRVMVLLNKDFVTWVAIAFIIGCPIAWIIMNKWLQNYATKTELSWWIFALAGIIAIIIALFTVSLQSWRAATKNPVDALRDE